jgi:hypothetical protein
VLRVRVITAQIATYAVTGYYYSPRDRYGTDTNEIKNQTSKWRAEHPLLRVLAPLSVFAEVGSELRVIVGEPPIKADKGDLEEENWGQQREPVWFLDLPGQVTLPKRHPWLALREPDVEDEAELRFVQSHCVWSCLKLGCGSTRLGQAVLVRYAV